MDFSNQEEKKKYAKNVTNPIKLMDSIDTSDFYLFFKNLNCKTEIGLE